MSEDKPGTCLTCVSFNPVQILIQSIISKQQPTVFPEYVQNISMAPMASARNAQHSELYQASQIYDLG